MSAAPKQKKRGKVRQDVYEALAEFRHHIRCYLDFADRAAKAVGIEPKQYQLLLALKGLGKEFEPTVGAIAKHLHIRHHSAVELINRAEKRGLVKRSRSGGHRNFVYVTVTAAGERALEAVVIARLEELRVAGPLLAKALSRLTGPNHKL